MLHGCITYNSETLQDLTISAGIALGGAQKRADSYFPQEDRVRLVRLVSHGELPGERSGETIVEYSWNSLYI